MSASSNAECPVCKTAEVVCGKWTLLMIRDLAEGNCRFCELERSLEGISPRTLALRLRALVEGGVGGRRAAPPSRGPPAGPVPPPRKRRNPGGPDRGHAGLRQSLAPRRG